MEPKNQQTDTIGAGTTEVGDTAGQPQVVSNEASQIQPQNKESEIVLTDIEEEKKASFQK